MEKVNNILCNVNNYSYNEEKKELIVNYKLVGEKKYQNFSKESYIKISELNKDNKTIGTCLRKELEK